MPYQTYSANIIADYFRACCDPDAGDVLSNLKLQKLCYYGAGVISAVRADNQTALINDQIEAWQHGPVVPTQYRRFAKHGAGQIDPIDEFDFGIVGPADTTILNDVYQFYGQYSAWKLRNMTHEEPPWVNAYARADKTISLVEMSDYFSDDMSKDYIDTYREASAG